jgi:hypothetical protein
MPNTLAKYGGYGGVFEKLLASGIRAMGDSESDMALESKIKVSKYNIMTDPDQYPELDDIDAILMTGSSP